MEYIKNVVLMEDFTVLLTDKVELFGHFVDTFKKYKSWIYNDKLLPAIVNQTNHILHNIFQNRVLKLNFEFVDNNVLFTVLDELNEINMEKLSGAQSFAVSLSFRLALSSIGINKFRCNQLFIDEGFCSFDQKNLLNVPTLIKNLKNLFQEIILVTHLEDIKSCADCVVNITRKHGISQIRH
jgi:DNA repair exonuclease SbcCD ATPase subunit